MALTEIDQLEAIRNRLKRRADYHLAKAQEYNGLIEGLNDIQRTLSEEEGIPIPENETPAARHERPRGAVTDGIKQYIRESGVMKFTPAQVVHYLIAQLQVPNSKELYNSAYRALTRMVEKGDLVKENEFFIVPKVPNTPGTESL